MAILEKEEKVITYLVQCSNCLKTSGGIYETYNEAISKAKGDKWWCFGKIWICGNCQKVNYR